LVQELEEELNRQHDVIDKSFEGGSTAGLLSLWVDGCIENARDYHNRGAHYTVNAIHAGGIPDTANSLSAIKRWVFEEKRLSLEELRILLRNNWQGQEQLRREIRSKSSFYGNDNDAADSMAVRIYDDYVRLMKKYRQRAGVLRPAGISTFGREIAFRDHRQATAFGALSGEILATNLGPTPGTDMSGPTAVIRSFCKMDFRQLPNGAPLELKLHPSAVAAENGVAALVGLLKAFVCQGGMFLHIDVIDSALLREAQKHPEHYPNLAVRISGWSARFNTLDESWQEMIIQRTMHTQA